MSRRYFHSKDVHKSNFVAMAVQYDRHNMKSYSILKTHCQYIWYVGSGNFWFEEGVVRPDNTVAYRIFQVILFSSYIFMTIFEILAVIYGDFPADEHGDCVTFSVSHTIVILKIFFILRNKNLIRSLNEQMVEICEEHEDEALTRKKYKIIKMNICAYFAIVYGTVLCFIFEGFRKMHEGTHFVTIVTYYPPYEDNSPLATTMRVIFTLVLCILMMTMIISIDSFTVMYLIMFIYKIITLKQYLERIRITFDKECKINLKMASKNLKNGLLKAIVMHGALIRMCKDIDKAFGNVVTLQLCLSSGSVVSLLLQLALATDLTPGTTVKILAFVCALYFLLALFLCNAGDITYQAYLLSDAFFYSGWHLCESPRELLPLTLLSIKQSQRPLVMKAFKMVELTYSTFLQVVRTTYSVFALFYAQNK